MLTWIEDKKKEMRYLKIYPLFTHRNLKKKNRLKSYNSIFGLLSDRLQSGGTQRRDYVSQCFLQLICTGFG